MSPDAELTLLAFALARGSVAKVLQALSCISDHFEAEYKASSLIVSMASVRLRLLNRNGNVTGLPAFTLIHTRTFETVDLAEKVLGLQGDALVDYAAENS